MRPMPVILVVEDEAAIAQLITVNLRHNGFKPVWMASGPAAQAAIDAELPDAIVLDWMLPGESGLSLAKRWRQAPRTQDVPILMLTARGDEAERVAGLEAGADDYIVKPFSVKELLARIRAVLRRRQPELSSPVLRIGQVTVDANAHQAFVADQALKLGPTEFKLLTFLLSHPQRVHSRAQLMDQVWGDQAVIEERTIDVHVKRLREALGDAAPMVETVRGVGYRLVTQAEKPALAPAKAT
jgi:two-component system phosphate regulon response regulator PhoB